MIPTIKKILYTTDLSDNSAYALGYAINSAEKHDADIVILNVIEPLNPATQTLLTGYFPVADIQKILDEKIGIVTDQINKQLKLFCDNELEDNPGAMDRIKSIIVCEGNPADEIIRRSTIFYQAF